MDQVTKNKEDNDPLILLNSEADPPQGDYLAGKHF